MIASRTSRFSLHQNWLAVSEFLATLIRSELWISYWILFLWNLMIHLFSCSSWSTSQIDLSTITNFWWKHHAIIQFNLIIVLILTIISHTDQVKIANGKDGCVKISVWLASHKLNFWIRNWVMSLLLSVDFRCITSNKETTQGLQKQ